MKIRNRLKELLFGFGIKTIIPTEPLLREKLGGMTPHRFNQILNNESKTELTVLEASLLRHWLSEVTGQPASAIVLLEEAARPDQLNSLPC
ncbi:MAG: hypothetical protein ACRYFK_07585 [Janthinobacterium lividum]